MIMMLEIIKVLVLYYLMGLDIKWKVKSNKWIYIVNSIIGV